MTTIDTRPPKLVADGLSIEYQVKRSGERFQAVKDITFEVSPESFTCIVGASGCGKSTFLSAVAGLLPYTGGSLSLDGRLITGPGNDRAVVFQTPALLPWRNVLGNVVYGLELRGTPEAQARVKAQEMIKLVGLAGNENRFPHELSGGMQQRVNLARALAADPELLLLDEPFAALDAITREVMQGELLDIWQKTRKTALFVTHQIDEAVFLADRIVVLSRGPGSVVTAVVDVDFPRPRTDAVRRSPEFLAKVDEVWALIKG
ncbi:MAG: transporter ATP-binding protein [Frankiales bacterium]|nr:transporter ATP-binding protein [Frankiales bacterium]